MGWPFGESRRRLGKSGRAGRNWARWKNFPGGHDTSRGKKWKGWQFWENLEALENSGSREKNMLYWKKLEIRARAPERGPLTNTGNSTGAA